MKPKSFAGMRCSIAGAMELIGDRWSLLLIRDLLLGVTRFDDFRKSLDIPTATLSTRLKHLETSGIVERLRYQDRPPRNEYHLTPKGRDLWKVASALREWGDRWDACGVGGPPIELVDKTTGHSLLLGLVDSKTGEAVSPGQAILRPGPAADASVRRLLSQAQES